MSVATMQLKGVLYLTKIYPRMTNPFQEKFNGGFLFTENESEEEEEENKEEDDEDQEEEEDAFVISDFINEDGTFDNTGEKIDDSAFTAFASPARKNVQDEEDPEELEEKSKKLEEVFSCLPPVLIKRILRRDDVRGDIDKASQRLQEFQDMENPLDIFKNPVPAKPPTEKLKGRIDDSQVDGPGIQGGDRRGEQKSSRGAESKNFRGKKKRRSFGNENEVNREQGEFKDTRDTRRNSFDNNKVDQRGGYQAHRGQNTRQSGGGRSRPRGGPRGAPRGGFVQGQGDYQGFSDNNMGMPVPLMSQEWGFGEDNTFQPLRGHGSRGGRGHPPKPNPKPKNRSRGYRGRGNNVQRQGQYQPPGGFHEEDQSCGYDQYQYTQRQRYPERGRGQQNQGQREARGRNAPPVFLGDLASGNVKARRACDDSDLGPFGGVDSNRRGQGNRGRPRDSGRNSGRGQTGMRRAQSLSNVVSGDQSAADGENVEEQSRFERNKLLVCGLSKSTTDDAVVNFIEAMSGEEVKEVVKLRNGNALVTMVDDITGK